jgi:hypothetical protein
MDSPLGRASAQLGDWFFPDPGCLDLVMHAHGKAEKRAVGFGGDPHKRSVGTANACEVFCTADGSIGRGNVPPRVPG